MARDVIKTGGFVAFVTLAWAGPGQVIGRIMRRRIARGETIWLDKFGPGQATSDMVLAPETPRAQLNAQRANAPRKAAVMKLAAYPEPRYPFAYRTPPESGNATNGLGETTARRARIVFHSDDLQVPLGGLEGWFRLKQTLGETRSFLRHNWSTREQSGPVSQRRWDATDARDAAERVKNEAKALGAALVGITHIADSDRYEDYDDDNYPNAISIAVPMRREDMLHAPSERSSIAVLDGYCDVAKVAHDLAARIRSLGWQAVACTSMTSAKILHIPIAARAGLGQLGKHGSLITRDYGSNVRLATVLTTLPLAHDQPRDIGVDDFCHNCRICETNCPPGAIIREKQVVRGVSKWYVDFDKCIPYFVEHHACGICIEVCPWSTKGQGAVISTKALTRRLQHKPAPSSNPLAVPKSGAAPPLRRSG